MSTVVGADDVARREIVERLDATMLVEAGAGTGKTRALVDRVVALVARGTRIERIAAITFTERAAAELRERVRAGLDDRIAEEGPGSEVAALCERARADLDRAQLSTIHAFGQSLLRALSAEAGIDPDMVVLDQLSAERRFEERWRIALEKVDPADPDGVALDVALGRGLTIAGLRTLAWALTEREDIAAAIAAAPPFAPPVRWEVIDEVDADLAAVECGAVADDDKCLQRLDEVRAIAAAARDAGDPWARDVALAAGRDLYGRRPQGRQGNWGGKEALEAAKGVIVSAGERLAALLDASRTEALCGILPWLARTTLDDARARREAGTLVFADLILWSRNLLRDDPSARAALRERYDALLIDEFQDTDPWQVDIAEAFACADDDGLLEPGRLFLVGDPKQSIYRFRRADMAVYAAERARVSDAGGLLPALTENRRSRSVVIDWVNAVVGAVIGQTDDRSLQPPYVPIAAERTVELEGPGVAWMGEASPERAWEVRIAEARDVAATCRAAVDAGWQVQDRDGGPRPAALRDIAVLIPARTGLSTLERALRAAGVPFRVEGGSLVFRTQELRDLINCLTAIDDPSDEVAVVGALRSAAFACSDVELAEHRRAGLRFNYLAPALDGAPGPVAEALRCLRAHHGERHDGSLATVVERFVAERRMVEVGLVDGRSRDAYRRARFVLQQARAFEADRPQGLRAFVAWLEERTTGPMLERDGSGLDDDEDAVRILTVHASKGLEFPIVILAGIGANPPYAPPPTVSRDTAGGIVATVGSKTSGRRLALGDVAGVEAREADHQHAEGARLLYVAATRARDHLVVSLHHQATRAGKSGARRLIDAGAMTAAPRWEPPAVPASSAIAPLADLTVDAPGGTEADHHAARAALVARSRRLRYTSATGLAAGRDRPATEGVERGAEGGDEPWARGRGGSRVGRAVHASIQSLTLASGPQDVEAVAAAQAVAEAVPDRAHEVAALVRVALLSQAAARARTAPGALREVPFALRRGDTVVEGFIDLVIPSLTGLEIVDWKTDDVAPGAVGERLAGYRLQAGLYALGLTEATGLPVERITYVFLRADVEVSPGDPQELARAAAAQVAAAPV